MGNGSHAEGLSGITFGDYSHSEGKLTTSIGNQSHSEGRSTISSGTSSHAEGWYTTSIGVYSHSEGYYTTSIGDQSHTQGAFTVSSGASSFSGGQGTIGGFNIISSGLASFNHSYRNDSTPDVSGATGSYSAILGGRNNSATGIGTVVLGGNGLVGDQDYTTYVEALKLKSRTVPSSPEAGTIYFSSADSHFYGYDGSVWKQLDVV